MPIPDARRAIIAYFLRSARLFIAAAPARAALAGAALAGPLAGEARAAGASSGGALVLIGIIAVLGLFFLGLRQLGREKDAGRRRECDLEREGLTVAALCRNRGSQLWLSAISLSSARASLR